MHTDKMTRKVQEALSSSQAKAVHWRHVVVDVEHLLMALIEQPGGLLPRLLAKMDVPIDDRHADRTGKGAQTPAM